MSIPNDPNRTEPTLYDQLKDLRAKFFASLIALVEDAEGKPVIPSHQEMGVIRGVLRDNNMNLPPEDPDALRAALKQVASSLPSFDDEDFSDE